MKKFVHLALAALFLHGIASAQNIPPIDAFGGFSYLGFSIPSNSVTEFSSTQLDLEGWQFAGSVRVLRSLAAEVDIAGHSLSNCGDTGLNCTNFTYTFGPRYNIGDHSKKITGYVHAMIGQDRMTLPVAAGGTQSDTTFAFTGGGGATYWFLRHIGVEGVGDYVYTHHLNEADENVPSQGSYRIAGGVAFRFGGNFEPSAPKPSKRAAKSQPAPVVQQAVINIPGRGMAITALGVVVAPQEFDGAKVVEVTPGGVAAMASLKVGDLIRSVDGRAIKTPMELAAELSDKTGKVRIGILRGDVATETLILLTH